MGIAGSIGAATAKRLAPKLTGNVVRDILERAIDGTGPLPGAAKSADARLAEANGDTEAAIKALTRNHSRLAGAQGFLTNLGGVVSLAVTLPANIAGLALVQCHLAAGIAHLRGYKLTDPSVRNAILACLLEDDARRELAKESGAPKSIAELATTAPNPQLDSLIATAVTGQLLANVGGRRMATFVARRVPVLGGGVGAVSDALSTQRIGRSVAKELRGGRGQGKVIDA